MIGTFGDGVYLGYWYLSEILLILYVYQSEYDVILAVTSKVCRFVFDGDMVFTWIELRLYRGVSHKVLIRGQRHGAQHSFCDFFRHHVCLRAWRETPDDECARVRRRLLSDGYPLTYGDFRLSRLWQGETGARQGERQDGNSQD